VKWQQRKRTRNAEPADHLRSIRLQLEHWQHNLANRVADEAQALELELDKLQDHELDRVLEVLRAGREHVLAGCDAVRDMRRQLQERHEAGT
jgi:hypothetical protein